MSLKTHPKVRKSNPILTYTFTGSRGFCVLPGMRAFCSAICNIVAAFPADLAPLAWPCRRSSQS
jgi:hypothetical protein